MGSGSSVKYADSSMRNNTIAATETDAHAWLMAAVDRERLEKQWLAQKYQAANEEAQALQQEWQRLWRMHRPHCSGETQQRASLQATAVQKGAVQSLSLSPASSSKSGLTERCGMRLSVSVESTRKPGLEAIAKVVPRDVVDETHTSPGTDSTDEPLSALLRRRRENWSLQNAGVSAISSSGSASSRMPLLHNTIGGDDPLSPVKEERSPGLAKHDEDTLTQSPAEEVLSTPP